MNLAYENVKEVDGLDVSKDGSEAWEAAIKRLVAVHFNRPLSRGGPDEFLENRKLIVFARLNSFSRFSLRG